MKHLEDLHPGDVVTAAPVVVDRAQLDAFLALTGERHPLHTTGDVLPAGLLHSLAAGALVTADGPWDVVGLRSMAWRCHAPACVGAALHVVGEVRAVTPVTGDVGVVDVRRTVRDGDGTLLATGDVSVAVGRRAGTP